MQDIIFALIGAACAVAGTVVALAVYNTNAKKDCTDDGKEAGNMMAEIGYIKSGVDDIKGQLRRHDDLFLKVSERVTAVEESAKQAHLRISRMEEKIDHE